MGEQTKFSQQHWQIKSVLQCNDEQADHVRRRLAAVWDDPLTRAFLLKHLHIAHTTMPAASLKNKAATALHQMWEGQRQFGLFLLHCAGKSMDLAHYSTPITHEENT